MLEKLRRETLAERAAESLLHYIAAQDLKPGEPLPSESHLSVAFGVSRPVIREALKSLQGKGVIAIINGKGAIVRSLDSATLRAFFVRAVQIRRDATLELMEVRRGVEVQSAILAAVRRTPDEMMRMTDTVTRMRERMDDPDAYTDLDVDLHLLIASSSHNALIYHLVESIREALKDSVREGLRHRRSAEEVERVQALHEILVGDLRRGDADAAGRTMALHFDEAVTALVTDDLVQQRA